MLKDFLDPLRRRQHVPSKRRQSIALLLNVGSKKTSVLNKNGMKTSNISKLHSFRIYFLYIIYFHLHHARWLYLIVLAVQSLATDTVPLSPQSPLTN